MKIKIVTKDHQYQGLYHDTVIENAQYITDDTVGFKHNGKNWTIARDDVVFVHGGVKTTKAPDAEHTGGSVNYYKVHVANPTTLPEAYDAEANDIIESLGLTFAEGNLFKAIWRMAADRNGKKKKGNNSVYDAEKLVFFAERVLVQEKAKGETI
jgi:hypothetical protein